MKKQAQPQRGAKMHKEGEEPLIMGMKQIAEGRADFFDLKKSALSASSAVNSSRTFRVFFCVLSCLFVAMKLMRFHLPTSDLSALFAVNSPRCSSSFFVSSRAFSWP
jgi:hypothetical protein